MVTFVFLRKTSLKFWTQGPGAREDVRGWGGARIPARDRDRGWGVSGGRQEDFRRGVSRPDTPG